MQAQVATQTPPADRVFRNRGFGSSQYPWGTYAPDYRSTLWFRHKADADRYVRTGDGSKGVALAVVRGSV